MDRLIVSEKLESLRRCIERIEVRRKDAADALARDVDAQDIISLNLTRAVQLCVDVASHVLSDTKQVAPATMGEAFSRLADEGMISSELAARMRAAVGFRNLAVHAYRDIDWNIVQRLTFGGLDDLRAFARAVAERLV